MDDDESISIKTKVDDDDKCGHDLLSDLPLCIIQCILVLLPIKDAIKTCILSKHWRHTWTSLPTLVFNFNEEYLLQDKHSSKTFQECLENLSVCTGPIDKFVLSVSSPWLFPEIDHCEYWVSRNIVIRNNIGIEIEIYNHSLVFHQLKSISIYNVDFRNRSETAVVFSLIMGAPHLEHLILGAMSFVEDASEAPTTPLLPIDFTVKKLRFVEMYNVRGIPYEMEVIKFLLGRCPVLEWLLAYCSRLLYYGPRFLDYRIEAISYRRRSPKAKMSSRKDPGWRNTSP